MPTKAIDQLIERGYMPVDFVLLHPSNTFIIPLGSDPERCWWKGIAHLQDGKLFVLEGEGIEDLAEALSVQVTSIKKDPDGRKGIPLKLLASIPIIRSFIENSRNLDGHPIQSLWAKVEPFTLHLTAFLEGSSKPVHSTHIGNCEVIWKINRQER